MGHNKVVLFDMDGVFADLEGGVIRILRDEYPYVVIPRQDLRRSFYLDEEIDAGHRYLVAEIIARRGFFASLSPVPGAIEAVKHIATLSNVTVMICTSPLKQGDFCIEEKYEWIGRYLGDGFAQRTIMTRDKTVVRGEYLVDDKHEVLGGNSTPSWEHVIHTQSHNMHLKNRRRVDLTHSLGYKWFFEELKYD